MNIFAHEKGNQLNLQFRNFFIRSWFKRNLIEKHYTTTEILNYYHIVTDHIIDLK